MKPSPREEGLRWLRQAQQDIDDAHYACQGKRFNLACFMAQQAAEKAIKGYLYARGLTLVIGHSVARLCQEASTFDATFEELRQRAAPLDKYYIPTRYPNGLPGGIPSEAFDQVDGERALELGQQVIRFVEERFPAEEAAPDESGGGQDG
ncbi:MAG: HEPN domain-containing protein [Anaerolineae bacterium]